MLKHFEMKAATAASPESAALRHRRTMKILIKPLDEDWALRERHVLTRRGDALPHYTQALIDSIMKHPGHAASRESGKKRRKAGGGRSNPSVAPGRRPEAKTPGLG